MKTFRVYTHPGKGFEAVKAGFSWPAFFFNVAWVLVKRLWAIAGICFGLLLVLWLFEAITDAATTAPGLQLLAYLVLTPGYFALWLIPAFRGNGWRCRDLERRGYQPSLPR